MSQRNKGIYEPEFRLIFTFAMLMGALSYMGWAIGNDNHMPWIGAVACLACVESIFPSPMMSHGATHNI